MPGRHCSDRVRPKVFRRATATPELVGAADGDRLDFDPRASRQGFYRERRARGRRVRHETAVDRVESREVVHVGQEARRFDNVAHRQSRGVEDGSQIEQDALGLSLDTALHELPGRRIEARLTGHEDETASVDRLAVARHGRGGVAGLDGASGHEYLQTGSVPDRLTAANEAPPRTTDSEATRARPALAAAS